jgi:hypothetical protein
LSKGVILRRAQHDTFFEIKSKFGILRRHQDE